MEIGGIAGEPLGQENQFFRRECGLDFVLWFPAPAFVLVPIVWKLAQGRLFLYAAGALLSGF
jgi:hypothetical protein